MFWDHVAIGHLSYLTASQLREVQNLAIDLCDANCDIAIGDLSYVWSQLTADFKLRRGVPGMPGVCWHLSRLVGSSFLMGFLLFSDHLLSGGRRGGLIIFWRFAEGYTFAENWDRLPRQCLPEDWGGTSSYQTVGRAKPLQFAPRRISNSETRFV